LNILFVTNRIDKVCGVSNHIKTLMNNLSSEINCYLLSGGGDNISAFKSLNIEIIIDKKIRHEIRSYSNYLYSVIKVIRICKKNKIDLIHAHTHYHTNIAKVASRYLGIKVIQSNHGLLKEQGKLNHFSGDKIIVLNEYLLKYLKENNFPRIQDVVLIRNGFDIGNKNINVEKIENKKLKILCASRYEEEKGITDYIISVSKIKKEYFERCKFYLIGSGSLETELKKLNNKYGNKVIFLPPVENLNQLLISNDIFVFCSRAAEGLPTVLIEAGINNNLIITSDFEGYESIIRKDVDALVFKKNVSDDLKDKIEYAVNNLDKLQELKVSFFEKIKEQYNLKQMISKTIALYEECTGK